MKKLKSVCIFLIAAAVIILGAMLPVITGMIQDHATMGNIDYGDINELHFELRDMTMAEKMYLFYNSTTVDITERRPSSEDSNEMGSTVPKDEASEDVSAIFLTAIEPYIQNGLIQYGYSPDEIETKHFIAYDTEDPNISNVFWLMNSLDSSRGDELSVLIDDQTGIAMAIEYITLKPIYDNLSIEELMWQCYRIFFDNMGVNIDNEAYVELVDVNTETGTQTMYITWNVDDGSIISMELSISENGFGIYITDVIKPDTEVATDN